MDRVINNELQPVVLEDGTLIPVAGTAQSAVDVNLSDKDRRRHVETGRLTVLDARPLPPAATRAETTTRTEKESN